MSITTLEKLKSYFKTGAKPTQEQFHALLDSYVHKDEDTSYILQGLAGATFMGVATPDSVPPVPTQKVFYIANEVGVYPNYGGLSVADGEIAFFTYNGSWSKVALEDVASSREYLYGVNNKIIFNNDTKTIVNDGSTDGLFFDNGNPAIFNLTELNYGTLSGQNGNISLVVTKDNTVAIKETLINLEPSDKIIMMLRVKFLNKEDTGYSYIIDHIVYSAIQYELIENNHIKDYNSFNMSSKLAFFSQNRNVDFANAVVYNYIFSTDLTVYSSGNHYRIPVLPGFVLQVQSQDSLLSRIVFLKGLNSMSPIDNARRIDVPIGETKEFVIPDNCYAVFINKIDGAGVDLTPKSVVVKNYIESENHINQNEFYTLGKLVFNNIDKTINIVGDSGVTLRNKDGNLLAVYVNNIPYGTVLGTTGYVCLVADSSGVLSLKNNIYVNSAKEIIIATVRVEFESSDGGGNYQFSVERVYSCPIQFEVIKPVGYKTMNTIPYYGNRLMLNPTLKCTSFGRNALLGRANGKAAQGMAIYNGYLFQLYNTGFVRIYDITKNEPIYIGQFNLGSYSESNHANSAQFGTVVTDSGFPYLYVAHATTSSRKLSVEKINLSGSTLMQTITFAPIDALPDGMAFNAIVGDDGYIWTNGFLGTKLYFAKYRLPDISSGDITIGNDYLVDSWIVDDYIWEQEVNQDIAVYNGKFYFQYGGTYNKRGIKIYDTATHVLINNIDLTNYVSEEFEGLDIFNGRMYITLLADKGYEITFD